MKTVIFVTNRFGLPRLVACGDVDCKFQRDDYVVVEDGGPIEQVKSVTINCVHNYQEILLKSRVKDKEYKEISFPDWAK